MAFTTTLVAQGTGAGTAGLRMKHGTWTNTAGSTGGTLETGFAYIAGILFTPTSHFHSAVPRYEITASDGSVTLTTEADVDGRWIAWGMGEAK